MEPKFEFWRSFPTKLEAEVYMEDVSKRWDYKVFEVRESKEFGTFDVYIAEKLLGWKPPEKKEVVEPKVSEVKSE